jgi:hypothetical protein
MSQTPRQTGAASPAERTLDELEGTAWPPPAVDTRLVSEAHRLRRVPLKEFRVEDLRLMIGQNVGAAFLVPRALDILSANPWAEGDCYAGDLLAAVLRRPDAFWLTHPVLIPSVRAVIQAALASADTADTIEDLPAELRAARDRFEQFAAAD